jgi:hypothetical protein
MAMPEQTTYSDPYRLSGSSSTTRFSANFLNQQVRLTYTNLGYLILSSCCEEKHSTASLGTTSLLPKQLVLRYLQQKIGAVLESDLAILLQHRTLEQKGLAKNGPTFLGREYHQAARAAS